MPPFCFNTSLSLLGMDKQSFSRYFLSSFFHCDTLNLVKIQTVFMFIKSRFERASFIKVLLGEALILTIKPNLKRATNYVQPAFSSQSH